MQITKISSKDNPNIKEIKKLNNSAKYRFEKASFVIEGLRILTDAVDNSISFSHLFFTEEFETRNPDHIKKFISNSTEVYVVSKSLLDAVCDTKTPQGVLAIAKMPKISFDIEKKGKYIALENLQDPANLGAVARTAEALGIDGIFVSADSCDIFSPKVLRASMGTLLRIPVYICEDLLKQLKNCGLKTYACVVHGDAEKLGGFTFEDGSAAVIGNEGNGLTDSMINGCDKRITIPMNGRAESLNAAVAASIVMWEMVSQ